MLYRKIKEFLYKNRYTIAMVLSLFLYTTEALAATGDTGTFSALITSGKTMFSGLRKVIYPADTIGIASVCIGGMFGSFNWRWLIAIMLGVFVIAFAEQVGALATGSEMDMEANMNGNG